MRIWNSDTATSRQRILWTREWKGLNLYILITSQEASKGGLMYYKNPTTAMEHEPTSESGFSLKVKNINELEYEVFKPGYEPGDCSIHHSRSIHFANDVPKETKRGLEVRLSLYAEKEKKKEGHEKWYKEMIRRNRAEQFKNTNYKMRKPMIAIQKIIIDELG